MDRCRPPQVPPRTGNQNSDGHSPNPWAARLYNGSGGVYALSDPYAAGLHTAEQRPLPPLPIEQRFGANPLLKREQSPLDPWLGQGDHVGLPNYGLGNFGPPLQQRRIPAGDMYHQNSQGSLLHPNSGVGPRNQSAFASSVRQQLPSREQAYKLVTEKPATLRPPPESHASLWPPSTVRPPPGIEPKHTRGKDQLIPMFWNHTRAYLPKKKKSGWTEKELKDFTIWSGSGEHDSLTPKDKAAHDHWA